MLEGVKGMGCRDVKLLRALLENLGAYVGCLSGLPGISKSLPVPNSSGVASMFCFGGRMRRGHGGQRQQGFAGGLNWWQSPLHSTGIRAPKFRIPNLGSRLLESQGVGFRTSWASRA